MTDLTFFPPLRKLGARKAEWVSYDPWGKTTEELAKIGLTTHPVDLGADLSQADVLVVGAQAMHATDRLPFSPSDIHRGLRVVLFEQTKTTLEAMGFRTEDVVPRYAFPRVKGHPVLAGLAEEDLANWRGAGQLISATKDNTWPFNDAMLHWQNNGSVASVVIETPHRGAFTPVAEAEFDLAFTPLLEWRHGAGMVLFVQLDLTGRIGLEPAADLVARNIITYMDRTERTPVAAHDKKLVYIGDDQNEISLLGELGFSLSQVGQSGLRMSRVARIREDKDIVVLGRNVVADLSQGVRNRLRAYVKGGGQAVLLPRSANELATTSWPWRVRSAKAKLARIETTSPADGSEILQGVGPQLLHWRTFLELNLIESDGLPSRANRLLRGLLVTVKDGRGSWVLAQFDWRQLSEGGNNTRRPRWNAAKFYRQLITNLGGRTEDSIVAKMVPPSERAPLVDVTRWRAATAVKMVDFVTSTYGAGKPFRKLPGLDDVFHTEPWPGTTDADWGQVLDADAEGYLDLTAVTEADRGKTAYARTYIYSSTTRDANFSFGAATWLLFKVNGQTVLDDSATGTWFPTHPTHPHPRQSTSKVELHAGWNRLELIVTGSFSLRPTEGPRLGFWVQTDNPGDLAVEPAVMDPTTAPAAERQQLLPERPGNLWYSEPVPPAEDVYRYMWW